MDHYFSVWSKIIFITPPLILTGAYSIPGAFQSNKVIQDTDNQFHSNNYLLHFHTMTIGYFFDRCTNLLWTNTILLVYVGARDSKYPGTSPFSGYNFLKKESLQNISAIDSHSLWIQFLNDTISCTATIMYNHEIFQELNLIILRLRILRAFHKHWSLSQSPS